jgi:hypothetical protein
MANSIESPVTWTNNFNDEEPTATVQFKLSGAASEDDVTMNVDEFVENDADGGLNWAVGDEFTIATDSTETVYSLSALAVDPNVATQAVIGFTPALAEDVNNNQLCTKEGPSYGTGYKGPHRSMENHIRLHNLGYI